MMVIGFFLVVYILVLAGLAYFGRAASVRDTHCPTGAAVSIVIPFRNEAEHLPRLVEALRQLTYPSENVEVIFVDDHSHDHGARWLAANLPANAKLVSLPGSEPGKKAALAAGIAHVRGTIIVTTDADCVMSPDWLPAVLAPFANPAVQLATGEVVISGSTFFSACQHVEFSTVMLLTRAAIRLGKPVLCNGANLAFRKSAYEQVGGYASHRHVASGDDEFLMRNILEQFGDASVAWHRGVVETQPQPGVAAFFSQRLRWASKWRHNRSALARLVAVLTFCFQAAMLGLWISIPGLGIPGFLLVMLKTLADVTFLLAIRPGHARPLASLVVSLVYPLYVVVVGLAALVVVPHRWKDRAMA